MDPLFGDLPPCESESNTSDVKESYLQLPVSLGKRSDKNNQNSTSKSKPVVNGSASTASLPLFKPMSLLRPKIISKSISLDVPKSSSSSVVNESSKAHTLTSVNSVSQAPIDAIDESKPLYDLNSTSTKTSGDVSFQSRDYVPEKENDQFSQLISFDCDDPYDPFRPNDYWQYCQERDEMKRKEMLELENIRTLSELQKAREEREKEKQQAVERGDIEKLQSILSSGPVTGRGRGMINLPAWMTQQSKTLSKDNDNTSTQSTISSSTTLSHVSDQFQDAPNVSNSNQSYPNSNSNTNSSSGNSTISTSFNSSMSNKPRYNGVTKPSRVLLLKNMVNPTDVDENLSSETAQECEKYGTVLECKVHVLRNSERFRRNNVNIPENEAVRVFVVFQKQESAVQAYRNMQGRYFDGKRIEAIFFDEKSYQDRHWDPNDDEIQNW